MCSMVDTLSYPENLEKSGILYLLGRGTRSKYAGLLLHDSPEELHRTAHCYESDSKPPESMNQMDVFCIP